MLRLDVMLRKAEKSNFEPQPVFDSLPQLSLIIQVVCLAVSIFESSAFSFAVQPSKIWRFK